MKNYLLYTIIIVLFNTINLLAGTIDPKAKDQDHINYGSQYDCVVILHGLTEDQKIFTASAVVIKKRWVLTAGHVIPNHTNHYVIYKDQKINIDKIILPDSFDINKFGKKDLAICRLENDINLDFYPELYTNKDEVGKVAGLAGYGNTGTFSTGAIKHDGLKRAGSNIIDYINDDLLICSVAKSPHTTMEFLIAIGDSGGGLFIDKQLAGIHSGIWNNNGIKPKSTYSTVSGHTRIASFKDWITENID